MENILLLDTSVASENRGDDIIMECVRKELAPILRNNFEFSLPTQVSPFHWYQVWRNSYRLQDYANCRLKFVGGSNLLVKNLLTHYPQWNINVFNYQPLKGCILVGVGAGAGEKTNAYTRYVYRKMLNQQICHSVRDGRSKEYVESLGLKAMNTGCVTMWALTPEFCKTIPATKASDVVFTLTASSKADPRDQVLIDTLRKNYNNVYFWPQGTWDFKYFHLFRNVEGVDILQATKEAYDEFLTKNDVDYVGTRLHGGIYAMRHKRRAIIIIVDERAREINRHNNLNCVDKDKVAELDAMINSEFSTDIKMDYDAINKWKSQFPEYKQL